MKIKILMLIVSLSFANVYCADLKSSLHNAIMLSDIKLLYIWRGYLSNQRCRTETSNALVDLVNLPKNPERFMIAKLLLDCGANPIRALHIAARNKDDIYMRLFASYLKSRI